MASFALKLLCIVAAAGVAIGSDNPACAQKEHDSPACLEDQASLLQTSSILQTREGSVETEQGEDVLQAFSGCGCSCTVSAFAKTMMASKGFTDARIASLIDESGCNVQKVSCLAEKEARRLEKAAPQGWESYVKSGDKCSKLLSTALSMVPPAFKFYINMVKPQCTGSLKLNEGSYQCPKVAKTTDSEDMSQQDSVKDTDAQSETVGGYLSKQGSDQDTAEQTDGSVAKGTDSDDDSQQDLAQDTAKKTEVQDTAKQTDETAAKETDIGDMYQQAAKSNTDGSLTWRQVLQVPQTRDLAKHEMRKLEKTFAQHDHDHDLTLSKDEVPTFVNAFKDALQATAQSR